MISFSLALAHPAATRPWGAGAGRGAARRSLDLRHPVPGTGDPDRLPEAWGTRPVAARGILAASGRLEEAVQTLASSVRLAEHIQTPREVWLGQAALGKVLARLGRDKEAEAQLTQATQTIEAIAANLHTPRLHHSFLSAAPVLDIYAALGHRPPYKDEEGRMMRSLDFDRREAPCCWPPEGEGR